MQNISSPTIKQDILPLTGLRFFAAAFVCLAHTVPYLAPGLDATFSRLSAEGMTLFFVLSGFVIHYNYSYSLRKNPAIGLYNFFVSRFARLYPLFFICICLDLIKLYGYSTLTKSFTEVIPYYLSMTQTWVYKYYSGHSLVYQFGLMSSVAWSISTEWFFYLFYPLICFVIMMNKRLISKACMMFAMILLGFFLMV